MGRRFHINIGGETVVAELLEDKAPNICKAFESQLPSNSFSVHAKFAGEELIIMVPFFENPENEILNVLPGDIGYYPGRQTICIFYGETKPFGKVSVFAKVVDGLDKLKGVGKNVLKYGSLPAQIYAEYTSSVSTYTQEILDTLRDTLHRVWDHEPQDIQNLREHSLPPMGNLPCVFYANFNTFWLGENVQVHRLLAKEQKVALQELNKTIAAILTRHAARLTKWNLKDTVVLVETLANYFEKQGPKNYDEFIQVTESILVVIDRINSWIDAMIPWSELDRKLKDGSLSQGFHLLRETVAIN
jgi:hypothetical protein